jgi:hypothetical protein
VSADGHASAPPSGAAADASPAGAILGESYTRVMKGFVGRPTSAPFRHFVGERCALGIHGRAMCVFRLFVVYLVGIEIEVKLKLFTTCTVCAG